MKFVEEMDGLTLPCSMNIHVDRLIHLIKEDGGRYALVNIFYNGNLLQLTPSPKLDIEHLFLLFMQQTRLILFGGENPKKCLNMIMKYLFTDRVLMQYSWQGLYSKIAFKSMNVNGVIFESVRSHFPKYTYGEFIGDIQKYLKYVSV